MPTSTFTTRAGVATREVGTITGRVELETTERDGRVANRIRYEGAQEWYHLVDEPSIGSAEAVHVALVGALSGPDESPAPDEAAQVVADVTDEQLMAVIESGRDH